MSAGGARRGRRHNGLDAAEYAVVGDVDPRVGEHLLDVLAAGGIAAYLQPASDLNPVTRTTTIPARPTDRLFVDRAHLSTARDYLARLTADEERAISGPSGPGDSGGTGGSRGAAGSSGPGGSGGDGPDIEAEWARIVAGFHTEVDPDVRPWPAAEHLDRAQDPTREPGAGGRAAGPGGHDAGGQSAPDPTAGDPSAPDATTGPVGDGTGDALGPADPTWSPPAGPVGTAGVRGGPGGPAPGGPGGGFPRSPGAPADPTEPGPRGDIADVRRAVDRDQWRRSDPDESSLLDALDTFGTDLPDDPSDDEGYTPPPPPPLPEFSKYSVAGALAMLGGFILFLFPHLVPLDPNVIMLFGFTCILAGFGTLIWRLRPGYDDDDVPDDPENGAVV